jgi:peptidyl-lysine (3S)-dioxygenase / protease
MKGEMCAMIDETSSDIRDSVKYECDCHGPHSRASVKGYEEHTTNSISPNESLFNLSAEGSPSKNQNTALTHLTNLVEDYHSFNPSQPSLLPYPSPLDFSKQVSKGIPAVYTLPKAHQFCPAQSWTRSSLISAIREPVEVAVTPNGRADSLQHIASEAKAVFLQPASIHMTLSQLFEKLDQPQTLPVYYLQSQNDNLNSDTPLTPLVADLPSNIPFAEDVLGQPEAINIWIGTYASVTSTHRDPYENLYLVLKGSKTFILFAPVDELALCAEQVRTGRYEYSVDNSEFSIVMDETAETIPWIPVDPLLPREVIMQRYPLYRYARPQRVTVSEGEILYLPAGWFHHVEQECGTWDDGSVAPCIAVNYWYDQDYEGEKYVMRQHVGRLVQQVRDDM